MTPRRNRLGAIREWTARVWYTVWPNRRDAELEQELQLHLELAAEDERRRSGSGDDVARRVVARYGAVAQSMEALRDQRGTPWLQDAARDLRYWVRSLRRSPLFTTVTLLTLAIGIGANTAIFTVLNSVLLRPLAYPNARELVAIWHAAPGAPGLTSVSGDLRLSPSMYLTYAEHNRAFNDFGVWFAGSGTVTGLAEPEQVRALYVSDGTLQALAVQPLLGRWLSQPDQKPGAPRTLMLGYGYWQRRFGGDRSVIGRGIDVESLSWEIVGVMPEGFRLANVDPEVIMPLGFDRRRQILAGFGFQGVARLKPGVSIEAAAADVARMVPIWMRSWPAASGVNPQAYESWRITPALRPLKQDVVGNVGRVLWVLMGTIGAVLAIACANVAGLLLVRADARQHELAIRAALGAGRERIVRGLLVESVFLGLLGGALGVGLSYAGLSVLVSLGPANLPRLAEISLDQRALGFTLVVSLLSGLLFGLIPALRYGTPDIAEDLRSGRTSSHSRERHRARSVLVVAQVALALVLLVTAGLMIRTLHALRTVQPGFTGGGQLQTMRISIPRTVVAEPARVGRMQNDIVDKLAAIPGVTSVGFASAMHMEGIVPDWDAIYAEHHADPGNQIPPLRLFKSISPGLFQTTGTRLIAGRDFTWTDLHGIRRTVMISENLARELWNRPSAAIGKRIRTLAGAPWHEVIGVVEDVRDNGVHQPAPAIVYWPALGESPYRSGSTTAERSVTFAIRSDRAGTEALLGEIRQAVWSVNATLPLASVRTMQELYDQSMERTSFTLVMLTIAAAMALLLGLVGIYGVISYSVSQRTREIGIRLALGAQQAELKGMFVRHGLVLVGVGVAIGLGAAAGLTRLMSSLLFGIGPLDPTTYAGVLIVLMMAALVASYLPARRVAAVDPVEALKAE